MARKIPVIVIFAPTASGKTALAVDMFGKGSRSFFNGTAEIVSADSMQAYRMLDIGTAKPMAAERSALLHHLIDIKNFDEQYSVSDFVNAADECCAEIFSRGAIPVVMGGTGFYIRNFILGLPETPVCDESIRGELKARLLREGAEALYAELANADAESARKINKNDSYRVIRALEIFYSSGRPRSSFLMNIGARSQYDFCILILERSRQSLYERIDRRVEDMFSAGLEDEVRALASLGASAASPAMKGIGYREWFDCGALDTADGSALAGDGRKAVIERVKDAIKRDSRRYAKRQITFMRGIPDARRICSDDDAEIRREAEEIVRRFLEGG
ncbi:MAG: tRNA (adenosine(37)-N6)-dimethylallyltransferase MiaA [Treponema sp.]